MQPNTIAYTYDHDNDGGTTAAVSVTLTRHEDELHKSLYRTANHNSTGNTDTLRFYRTLPKRAGNFYGTEKTAIKRTQTILVPDASGADVAAPMIADLGFSIPVGATFAQKTALLMELVGYLSSSEGKAAMLRLLSTQEI